MALVALVFDASRDAVCASEISYAIADSCRLQHLCRTRAIVVNNPSNPCGSVYTYVSFVYCASLLPGCPVCTFMHA